MPTGIVDRLESIQIQNQHGGMGMQLLPQAEGTLDPLIQQAAIGQPGQGVIKCQLKGLLFCLVLALDGITESQQRTGNAAELTVLTFVHLFDTLQRDQGTLIMRQGTQGIGNIQHAAAGPTRHPESQRQHGQQRQQAEQLYFQQDPAEYGCLLQVMGARALRQQTDDPADKEGKVPIMMLCLIKESMGHRRINRQYVSTLDNKLLIGGKLILQALGTVVIGFHHQTRGGQRSDLLLHGIQIIDNTAMHAIQLQFIGLTLLSSLQGLHHQPLDTGQLMGKPRCLVNHL